MSPINQQGRHNCESCRGKACKILCIGNLTGMVLARTHGYRSNFPKLCDIIAPHNAIPFVDKIARFAGISGPHCVAFVAFDNGYRD